MLPETRTNIAFGETRSTNEDRRMAGSREVRRQAIAISNACGVLRGSGSTGRSAVAWGDKYWTELMSTI